MHTLARLLTFAAIAGLAAAVGLPARPQAQAGLHGPLDKILDTYVRDGMVYYRALKSERAALDRYIVSLDVPRARVDEWSKADQQAFWVNAYNALVLRTVVNAYPISGRSALYPPESIRQIPGAFETVKHRVAGQPLTLDEIEKDVVAGFGDARLLLALGRGALGSGRLRSEAYLGSSIETQLDSVVRECAVRASCARLDRVNGLLVMSPILSWREDIFIATFAGRGEPMWSNRTPIERAAAAMIYPHLFQSEKAFLEANTFRMQYGTFDWRLNDLTDGGPR